MRRETAVPKLRAIIRDFLAGKIQYAQFERSYVIFFADNAADETFTESDRSLYTDLFERLQWTAEHPSALDLASGYAARESTIEWIQHRFADVLSEAQPK